MKRIRPPGYICWSDMKKRCYNKNNKRFKDYGGRGIVVCERWLNYYENFLSDMGVRPTSKHSLDRINNDGIYEPSNCRWATRTVQDMNRRKRKSRYGVPYRGVHPVLAGGFFSGQYQAGVRVGGKTIYLGSSPSAVGAALIFDKYQIKMNTPERLNFPSLKGEL